MNLTPGQGLVFFDDERIYTLVMAIEIVVNYNLLSLSCDFVTKQRKGFIRLTLGCEFVTKQRKSFIRLTLGCEFVTKQRFFYIKLTLHL